MSDPMEDFLLYEGSSCLDVTNLLLPDDWNGFLKRPIIVLSNISIHLLKIAYWGDITPPSKTAYSGLEIASLNIRREQLSEIINSQYDIDPIITLTMFAPGLESFPPLKGKETFKPHTILLARDDVPPIPVRPEFRMYYVVPIEDGKYAKIGNAKELKALKEELEDDGDIPIIMFLELEKGFDSHTIPIGPPFDLRDEFERRLQRLAKIYAHYRSNPVILVPSRKPFTWKTKRVRTFFEEKIWNAQKSLVDEGVLFINQVWKVANDSISFWAKMDEEIRLDSSYEKRYIIHLVPREGWAEFLSYVPDDSYVAPLSSDDRIIERKLEMILLRSRDLSKISMRLFVGGMNIEMTGDELRQKMIEAIDEILSKGSK